jgi:hypothetical protein
MTNNAEDKQQHPKVLTDYLRRINAEVLNFRRAMVKEHRGAYYIERTLIKINGDGSIDCSRKEHAPTEEEAKAIKAALAGSEFPRSVEASEASAKARIEDYVKTRGFKREDFYELRSRATGKIIMIQERRDDGNGSKIYKPHTLWSDNVWRELEPEGKLPFWKPKEWRASKIMVHEGSKAAAFVDWMLHDRSLEAKKAREAHPWTDELKNYEHWGMIGGAMAPHRTDYSELKREQPLEVVYVCDNDFPGREVLPAFSKNYGSTLKGIIFHQGWPESWDMADPMPKAMFSKIRGKYNGPSLKSLMVPATYATELIPNPSGKGRPVSVMKDAFAKEWMHSITPEAYIHHEWPSDILSVDEFNSRVRPFSDVGNTAKLLLACASSKSRRLHYKPGEKPGFSGNGDGAYINTFCPSNIKPIKGDATPWLDYMNMLVPEEEDRNNLMRWCATLIARPDIKMEYGVLLISETQGVGKTTLGERILAPIVGYPNTSFPSETDIVDSQFNSWIAHKRLAIVNEIYAGASVKAYNKLKNIVTDEQITVNKKHQATYEIQCWIHILACSNSIRALKLSMDDRRWLVPKITEEKQKPSYWSEFNNWLAEEGGLGIIMNWAVEYLLDVGPVSKGDNAPSSGAKRAMVEESLSPGQALVAGLLKEIAELTEIGDGVFTTDQRLIEAIKNTLYGGHENAKLERPGTIRKLAKDYGWFVGESRTRHWCPPGTNGYIISRDEQLARRDPQELKSEFEARATGNRPEERDFDLSISNLDAMRLRNNKAQSGM